MTDSVKDSDINDDPMVLRTVYLPPELDEKLRVHAFRSKITKGEVIRRAIAAALTEEASFGEDDRPASVAVKGRKHSASYGSQSKAKALSGTAKATGATTARIGVSTRSQSTAAKR